MDLQRKVGRFAGRVAAVFTREDQFPYYDAIIHDYKEDLEKYPMHTPKEVMKDCVLKLCRAFVHSKDMKDVKEGIQTLQDVHKGVVSPLQLRETLYLLAVGYYRDGDYTSSLSYLDLCLEIAPHFNQALTHEEKIRIGSLVSHWGRSPILS
ncbi:hypothetical protein MKW94_011740 [Papaver nudicaule]|uniref:Mitochondrial fission 1 protein n=1 Tax=Papaver nudicaule TaxID=74823 RepID=A0AA41V6L5_PAPNU|nr:hypothetical protein [Papaver nudicaule]